MPLYSRAPVNHPVCEHNDWVGIGSNADFGRLVAAVVTLVAITSCSGSTRSPHLSAPPPMTSRTNFDGVFYFTPRPAPPSTASLTASQAWADYAGGKPMPTFVTTQRGLLSEKFSLRPLRYRYRNRAVWAFGIRGLCPPHVTIGNNGGSLPPPHPCVGWSFVDASSGKQIGGASQDVKSPKPVG